MPLTSVRVFAQGIDGTPERSVGADDLMIGWLVKARDDIPSSMS
jgi:hypothetical protein